jgi:mitochondrial fission protein ELM1
VSAGVKNDPVCRWSQRQSGGRTRLVFLGRTWAARPLFDLIVTTPQYRLPPADNVLHNLMTQHGITRERLVEARERFRDRFADLPSPHVAVLLGGDSGPYVFGARAATDLAVAINRMLAQRGGSALVTSSARTRAEAIDALEANLKVPVHLHRFRPGLTDNPYLGMLAHADDVVVTSDSIAMLSEAAATGRLVHIFRVRAAGESGADETMKARAYALMMKLGPERLSRDLARFYEAFIAAGHGVWLGDPARVPVGGAGVEAEATAARVMALLPPHR